MVDHHARDSRAFARFHPDRGKDLAPRHDGKGGQQQAVFAHEVQYMPRLRFPCYTCSVDKLYNRTALIAARVNWKKEGKRVVFTNGCYDLLHPGHIRLLEQARSLGDILILALNSDDSVRRLKGPTRPLLSEQERAEVASGLAAVDAITVFDEDTPRELIAAVLPDVLVKGADWAHWIAGREEVEAAGGQVMALALEPGYSTTGIVEEILTRTP